MYEIGQQFGKVTIVRIAERCVTGRCYQLQCECGFKYMSSLKRVHDVYSCRRCASQYVKPTTILPVVPVELTKLEQKLRRRAEERQAKILGKI